MGTSGGDGSPYWISIRHPRPPRRRWFQRREINSRLASVDARIFRSWAAQGSDMMNTRSASSVMAFNRRAKHALVILGTASLLITTGLAASSEANPGLSVQDLNHGVTAPDLANALVGTGVTISNVTYTGANNAAGAFAGGTGIIGFDSGVILGSGRVQTTADPHDPCSKGVEGPNECDANTTENFTPGDLQLDALSGFTTFDAAILEFDFVPQFSTVQFSYVFSSDEYNEFVNSEFNDVFGFFVNGTNCATVGDPPQPVSINTINGGNPFGTSATNPSLYRNNDPDDPGPPTIDTEMDGLTVVLTCSATVNAGTSNHMKLAIADASDDVLDSNVLIRAGSLVSGTVITTSLSGGGQSGAQITVPVGTTVIDSSILSGANSGTAGGSVTYTVYSDNQCSLTVANAGTKTVTNGIVPDSDPVPFSQAGTFFWQAAYGGDANHSPGKSTCGAETVTVTQVHTILTKTASPTSGVAPLTVTYTYHETNDGTEPLSGVAVTDDTCSPVVRGPDSPGNNDATLDPGETWTFTCTHTFTTGGTFTNTATATGNTSTGAPAPPETATATVTVTTVHTTLTKTAGSTSGVAPLTVTYTYHEANDGTEPLSSVALTDDTCSPVLRGPDSPGNNDATLDPGETWTFTCTHIFTTAGTFTNTVAATGTTSTGAPAPEERATATITVTPPLVQALTPGFWKNHEAATTALLPQTLGTFTVGDFATATAVFAAMNCSNSSKSTQNAVGCLAGHLLAAKLNVANGASTCIAPTITAADAFLVSVGYIGPTGTYTLTPDQRATAISLKSTLDAYNNTGVCT
jgi:hypothetical protein